MFLISRLDMPQVANVIHMAVRRNIELSEHFLDQYWIFDRPQLEGTVEGAITINSDHERFPELMASINENTVRYVDAVRNARKPWDPRPATVKGLT
jgi:hypothetical protein